MDRYTTFLDTTGGTNYVKYSVVRNAFPDGDSEAYHIALSEPHRVVCLTDGYEVSQAKELNVMKR